MNRADEIQAVARDIADRFATTPEERNAAADELIKLIALVVAAVGKSVAIDGESHIGDPDDDSAHARYITGERIQDGARWVEEEAVGADLERYERGPHGHPVWQSKKKGN